jgi:[CysO sulfur-carrier protein]-S-L-cysteine hydrolase
MSGSGDALELPRPLLEAIYRHARASFPKECCGFVIGHGVTAELVECENWQDRYHALDPETYPRTAETAYTFGGKDLRRLAESLDSDRPATIVYHSHPRVGAYFSDEDSRAALAAGWPVDYLVVDCQEHAVLEAVLFRKHAERDEYVEVGRYSGLT